MKTTFNGRLCDYSNYACIYAHQRAHARAADSKMTSGIICTYAITNRETGMAYFGVTSNFIRRWLKHTSDLLGGRHRCKELQEAFDEHGIYAFEIRIVECYNTTDGLIDREDADCSTRFDDASLYNRRLGRRWINGWNAYTSDGNGAGYRPKTPRGHNSVARWFDGTAQRGA